MQGLNGKDEPGKSPATHRAARKQRLSSTGLNMMIPLMRQIVHSNSRNP